MPTLTPHNNPILTDDSVRRVGLESIAHRCHTDQREPLDKRQMLKLFRRQTAKEFIGTITRGFHRFGFSKGQFSLVDIVRGVSDQIGPSHLAISTWTVARADLTELQELISRDRFQSVRFLLDLSFQRRQPELIAHLRRTFGAEALRVTKNHAKFLLFRTEAFKIVCRTSMNLNFNPRLEDVELKDDPALFDFIESILDDIFQKHQARAQTTKTVRELTRDFAAHGT